MWVEREHALVLILGNRLLKDSFERLEVEQWVDVIVNKVDILLPPRNRVLDNGYDAKHQPHVIVPDYN